MAKEQEYLIDGDSGKLELLVSNNYDSEEKVTKIIVICHPHPLYRGTMHNKVITTIGKAFNHIDFVSIKFNYRGVGKSEGSYGNYLGEIEDCKSVINWALNKFKNADLYLSGFSFGSYIAAKSSEYYNTKKLISIAPAIENADYNSLNISTMWIMIQPEADQVIDPNSVYSFVKKNKKIELIIVSEASHFFHGKLLILQELLIQIGV